MPNQNTNKMTCKKGHYFSGVNSAGRRICKICINERMRLRNKNPKNKQYKLNWQRENKDKVNQNSKNWRKKNPDFSKKWDLANPEKRKAINKKRAQTPERKAYMRKKQLEYYHLSPEKFKVMQKEYRKNNPRSGAGLSYELQDAMMERRFIDKNRCQWSGCGKTSRETSIHVNHIFPRSECPELELVVQYMICYCAYHHAQWHKARGNAYWEAIQSKSGDYEETPLIKTK